MLRYEQIRIIKQSLILNLCCNQDSNVKLGGREGALSLLIMTHSAVPTVTLLAVAQLHALTLITSNKFSHQSSETGSTML